MRLTFRWAFFFLQFYARLELQWIELWRMLTSVYGEVFRLEVSLSIGQQLDIGNETRSMMATFCRIEKPSSLTRTDATM